jgi:hypothetical protein
VVLVVVQGVSLLELVALEILLLHQALLILMLCRVLLAVVAVLEVQVEVAAHQQLVIPIVAIVAAQAALDKHQQLQAHL